MHGTRVEQNYALAYAAAPDEPFAVKALEKVGTDLNVSSAIENGSISLYRKL